MVKQAKRYGHGDRAGCVTLQRNRTTGHLYGLYNAEQAGLDGGINHDDLPNPWVTVCEDHGTICGHRSLKIAQDHLTAGDWCEICMSEQQAAFYAKEYGLEQPQTLQAALGDAGEFTAYAYLDSGECEVQAQGGQFVLTIDGFTQGRSGFEAIDGLCTYLHSDQIAQVWFRRV